MIYGADKQLKRQQKWLETPGWTWVQKKKQTKDTPTEKQWGKKKQIQKTNTGNF